MSKNSWLARQVIWDFLIQSKKYWGGTRTKIRLNSIGSDRQEFFPPVEKILIWFKKIAEHLSVSSWSLGLVLIQLVSLPSIVNLSWIKIDRGMKNAYESTKHLIHIKRKLCSVKFFYDFKMKWTVLAKIWICIVQVGVK